MAKGYLNLVLHAHMPYMRHPLNRDHIEQRWFYEAVTDCYVPLVNTLLELEERRVDSHITLSISPTLCVMLKDTEMQNDVVKRMEGLIEFAGYEKEKNRNRPEISDLSNYYIDEYVNKLALYREVFKKDILGTVSGLAERGRMTLMTSAATHAFLPLLADHPQAVMAQIRGGMDIFREQCGREPAGFWLPECGYTQDIEKMLGSAGAGFTVVESHGILFSRPRPRNGLYMPVTGPGGVVLFGRDADASRRVWSAESGYPADVYYRDFYDDVVHELADDEVKRFVHPDGLRVPSGIKYRRVTGHAVKRTYSPEKAAERIEVHSKAFVDSLKDDVRRASEQSGIDPVITVAFDAELFGHWWYEGCDWLRRVAELISGDDELAMANSREISDDRAIMESVLPQASSWGHKGYSETWINPNNDWMIRRIYRATDHFIRTAEGMKDEKDVNIVKGLNMAARELMLLQSSDWSFMMNNGISEEYVKSRITDHYNAVNELLLMVNDRRVDHAYLERITASSGKFTDVDFRLFCSG